MDSPHRWNEICYFLEDQLLPLHRMLSTRPYEKAQGWEGVTEDLFELCERVCAEADAAARHLAERRTLPAVLSSDGAFLLAMRIQCANDFLGMVFPPASGASPFGEVPEQWSDEEVCEWLLIDLWKRRFDHWMKLQAIGVCGPFAFYGLRAAGRDDVS